MRRLINILGITTIIICSGSLITFNFINNSEFLNVSIIDILTFVLTFFILVYLVSYQSSYLKLKEKYEEILSQFQDEIGVNLINLTNLDAHITILKHNKKVSNLFTLLKYYSIDLRNEKLITKLEEKVKSYIDYISENITKIDQISAHECDRKLQNINFLCNQLKLNLYKKIDLNQLEEI